MISVIIPVFNGSLYLEKCYESLRNQTFRDWEAVFVDDGSIDDSYNKLISLSNLDSRIKVLHKQNEGVAVAREFGLKIAKGEFVTFLDVDDTLDSLALEHYVNNLTNDDNDVVIGGINMVSEAGRLLGTICYKSMSLTGVKAVKLMSTGALRWQLCAKAYRTSLFKSVVTPTGLRSAEDMAVCLQAIINAKSVKVLNKCFYNYVQVAASVTHSKAKEISSDALKATEFVEKIMGNKIDKISLDCLYLLIISGALRAGIRSNDKLFRTAIDKHCNLRAIVNLPLIKAMNVGIYKFLHLNLARYI